MKQRFCFASLLVFCCIISQAQNNKIVKQTYQFTFRNNVGDSLLLLEKSYQNHFGELFTIRNFQYYISHISIIYKDKKKYEIKAPPHLINEADSSSQIFFVTAPEGIISAVSFLLGIDSLTNVSGVQTGDLDPAKGMFWVWNTGYIMARLEGASPQSKAPARQFTYDVGGFKTSENAARNITLPVGETSNHQFTSFIITADVSKWFWGKNNIRISEHPMCHQPGKLAMQIADNYASMFSISAQ